MANAITSAVVAKNIGCSNTPKGALLAAVGSYTVPASGGPGIGEKVEMVPVPKGAKIMEIILQATNGTTNMTVSVGDGTTPARFISALANAAAIFSRMALGLGYEYPADDTIDITFGVAAPTATGVYTMVVLYTMA